MPVTILATRLREARLAADLSIQALADLVEIDPSVMRKIEKGTCGVSATRLALFARILKVRSSWLLGEDNDRELRSPGEVAG